MYDQFCFFCASISSEISVGYRRSHIPIGLVQRVFGIFQKNGLRDQLNVLVRMYCVQPLIIYSVQCISEGLWSEISSKTRLKFTHKNFPVSLLLKVESYE